MKNITLLLTLLLSVSLFSQENYPYKRPQLLVGKTVKVLPLSKGALMHQCGYRDFYEDFKGFKVYKKCNLSRTLHEALSNREFKVTSMDERMGYQSVIYMYTLEDTVNNEVVYYEYDYKYKSVSEYPFEVIGGLDLPADFYCDYIQTMNISTEHIRHKVEVTGVFALEKVTYEGETKTQLVFMSHSDNFAGKGYTIELADGQVIKDAAYPVGQYNNGARFFIHTLSKKDIEMLSKSRVVKFTMGNIKEKTDAEDAMLLQGALPCIISK